MREKKLQLLQFNGITWEVFQLGEKTLLLEAPDVAIEKIHESTRLTKEILGEKLIDIVPSYDSIALFYQTGSTELLNKLSSASKVVDQANLEYRSVEIPICYEEGLDLEEVAHHTGLSIESLIEAHLTGSYKSIFIGFTPGFIYMDGLEQKLACPRKSNPRKQLKAGSVGIGGGQTGIYSLASPGGWNIIGRTPLQLFDTAKRPPISIEIGSKITFKRITRKEFEEWGN